MGLVIGKDKAPEFLSTKMAVTDGQTTTITVDGVKYMDIIKYPIQSAAENGATVMMIEKPFIDFAASCGPKGAMTADMITTKFPEIDAEVAKSLADDFAIFHDNYVIIPDTCILCLTVEPIHSISELFVKEPEEG